MEGIGWPEVVTAAIIGAIGGATLAALVMVGAFVRARLRKTKHRRKRNVRT